MNRVIVGLLLLVVGLVGCPSSPGSDASTDSPPKISIETPISGETVDSGDVTITGSVSDDAGISQLQYSLNGATPVDLPSVNSAFSFSMVVPVGTHTVTVTATNTAGQSATAATSVTFVKPGIGGTVTVSNAGGPVAGTTVTAYLTGGNAVAGSAITNDNGFYNLKLNAGTYDLVLTKAGMAGSKVIGVKLSAKATTIQNIIQKPAFFASSLGYSTAPPVVTLEQVSEGAVYDAANGLVPYQVKVTPSVNLRTSIIYAAIGATPGGGYLTTRAVVSQQDSTGQAYLDPAAYAAGGDTTFEVVVYDSNSNRTHLIRRIKVLNSFFQNNGNLLSTPTLKTALAITSSKSLGFNNVGVRPQAAPDGADLYVNLLWTKAAAGSYYRVYRSFDNKKFSQILQTVGTTFRDASADLAVGKRVCYKVSNFIGNQESALSSALCSTPLPVWDARLATPSDDLTNVSTTPTFTWTHNAPAGTHQQYAILYWDTPQGTTADIANQAQTLLVDSSSWTWNQDGAFTGTPRETLQRGRTYEWQLYGAYAVDDLNNPSAISVAADGFSNYTIENTSTDVFSFTTGSN